MQQHVAVHGRNSKTMHFNWGAPLISSCSYARPNKDNDLQKEPSNVALKATGSDNFVSLQPIHFTSWCSWLAYLALNNGHVYYNAIFMRGTIAASKATAFSKAGEYLKNHITLKAIPNSTSRCPVEVYARSVFQCHRSALVAHRRAILSMHLYCRQRQG